MLKRQNSSPAFFIQREARSGVSFTVIFGSSNKGQLINSTSPYSNPENDCVNISELLAQETAKLEKNIKKYERELKKANRATLIGDELLPGAPTPERNAVPKQRLEKKLAKAKQELEDLQGLRKPNLHRQNSSPAFFPSLPNVDTSNDDTSNDGSLTPLYSRR